MIYFDSTSIYNRALQKLQQDPNWKVIANNSVISALLKSTAEVQAETARYAEYLFQESKWDTAQNSSSILAMSNMLGYQPKRKISARGQIYVSADPRTHLVGKTISSNYFDKVINDNTSNEYTTWSSLQSSYSITSSCTVVDSQGRYFTAIPTVLSKEARVTTLSLIQGQRKTTQIDIATIRNTCTSSKLDPYLYIPVTISNCEDASNPTSTAFFRVYLNYSNGTIKEYRVVDTLLLSDSTDYDVEVYNDMYSQNLFYLKFNNDITRGRVLDISANTSLKSIRIDYLESLGSEGNVLDLYETFTITGIASSSGTDSGLKLYGVNLTTISGGADEETVSDVKTNAPREYINSYTAGTKEAYETAIENMDLVVNGQLTRPRQCQVWGSTEEDSYGNLLPITCISFLADGLEDVVSSVTSTSDDPYSEIETALNYYLYRLKSPQDTLRFVAPNYVRFAIGMKCKIESGSTDDITQLQEDIISFIDEQWGSNSDELDYERNFYPSALSTDVMNEFEEVVATSTEVEAIKKLDWTEASRLAPKSDEDASDTIIHTMRVPFTFDNIFLGNQATKGFKDYRVGADYVMRIDVMYKKPKAWNTTSNLHVSIFIADGRQERDIRDEDNDGIDEITNAFWFKKDTSQSGIWEDQFSNAGSDYSYLASICNLSNSYQYYYRPGVFTDNDFRSLTDESSSEYLQTIDTYLINPGAIDDYLIYFSSDYEEDGDTIADGWIEFTFDPLYKMLSTFATYDSDLKEALQETSLSMLKCTNTDISDGFATFCEYLSEYVDLYVCLRPIDSDLVIDTSTSTGGSSVLYIDSYDGNSSNNIVNLTSSKRERMISVECEYEET